MITSLRSPPGIVYHRKDFFFFFFFFVDEIGKGEKMVKEEILRQFLIRALNPINFSDSPPQLLFEYKCLLLCNGSAASELLKSSR